MATVVQWLGQRPEGHIMISLHRQNIIIRGIVAILFGLAAFFWPTLTLDVFTVLFGIFLFLDSVVVLFNAFTFPYIDPNWRIMAFLEGVVLLALACVVLWWPGISEVLIVYMVAAWALVGGMWNLFVRRKAHGSNYWHMGASIVSILFGFMVMAWPTKSLVAIILMLGAYAVLYGALLVTLGCRHKHRV